MTQGQQRAQGPARTARAARPRSRGRLARRLIIVFAVLAGLLVAADFILAAAAEHTISQKVREKLALTADPAVTMHGFPFSTQAIGGEYGHISMSADGVPIADTLRDAELRAELYDVVAPLSELLAGNTNSINIGRLEGQVKIKATDIARVQPLNNIKDLRIQPANEEYVRTGQGPETEGANKNADKDPGGPSAGVRISGSLQFAGQDLDIIGYALITLTDHSIRITPERMQLGNGADATVVPPEVQKALLPNFAAVINTGNLPFQVTPTAVKVDDGSVTVKGEIRDVVFAELAAGR